MKQEHQMQMQLDSGAMLLQCVRNVQRKAPDLLMLIAWSDYLLLLVQSSLSSLNIMNSLRIL